MTTDNTTKSIRRQIQLPFGTSVRMAWQTIRVRLLRSLLVMSGIVLALAFLSHILSSEVLQRQAERSGRAATLRQVEESDESAAADEADAGIQTRWIVGLALLITFVGVLNAMLLSVTERFREIGTMKCLGALDSLIVRLFLLESLFMGFIGALLGALLGVGLTLLQHAFAHGLAAWGGMPVGALLRIVGFCLVLGVGLTVCGALYPAWRAARMQPVAALRSEV